MKQKHVSEKGPSLSRQSVVYLYSSTSVAGIASHDYANNTVYPSPYGPKFQEFCNVDWPEGETVYGSDQLTVVDLWQSGAYTFEDCMDNCAQWNLNTKSVRGVDTTQCAAVSYNANITSLLRSNPSTTVAIASSKLREGCERYVLDFILFQTLI